jgi:protein gp37
MSKNTKIEWTDHTFNPWWVCQKVGPGCDHCYAEGLDKRTGGAHWGPGAERRRTSAKNWNDPVRWNKQADAFFAEHGRRQRVFCASMADVFDNAVPTAWRMDLFTLIASTPNLDWLILTKRIGNVLTMCSGDSLMFDMICERVWLGATIVNQEEADRDIPKLLAVPAAKRFLSMEPLLGPVDLNLLKCCNCPTPGTGGDYWTPPDPPECCGEPERIALDWVIIGGESGPGARPMHPDWAHGLRDQCDAAGVPFLFKQWGDWGPYLETMTKEERRGRDQAFALDETMGLWRCGKKAAGRLLDGRTWDGYPL